MKLLIAALLSLSLLSACSRKTAPTTERRQKDSTFVRTTVSYQDTAIVVPSDSSVIRVPINHLLPIGPQNYQFEKLLGKVALDTSISSGRSTVHLQLSNGMVTAGCKCDSLELQLKLERIRSEYYQSFSDLLLEQKTVMERYIPTIIQVLAWIGGIAVVGIAIYFIIRFHLIRFKITR